MNEKEKRWCFSCDNLHSEESPVKMAVVSVRFEWRGARQDGEKEVFLCESCAEEDPNFISWLEERVEELYDREIDHQIDLRREDGEL